MCKILFNCSVLNWWEHVSVPNKVDIERRVNLLVTIFSCRLSSKSFAQSDYDKLFFELISSSYLWFYNRSVYLQRKPNSLVTTNTICHHTRVAEFSHVSPQAFEKSEFIFDSTQKWRQWSYARIDLNSGIYKTKFCAFQIKKKRTSSSLATFLLLTFSKLIRINNFTILNAKGELT